MEARRGHPGDRPPGRRMDHGTPPLDVPPRADGTRAQGPPVGGRHMEASTERRSSADMARDAEIERSDFLVRAGEQLRPVHGRPPGRIRQLGGLVLIDDDPDYLAVAPDGTFRSRSRVLRRGDAASGSRTPRSSRPPPSWSSSTTPPTSSRRSPTPSARTAGLRGADGADGRGVAAWHRRDAGRRCDPYAGAADQWAAGQPEVREATDEGSRPLAPVRARARLPGSQPALRGRPHRAVRDRRDGPPGPASGRSILVDDDGRAADARRAAASGAR